VRLAPGPGSNGSLLEAETGESPNPTATLTNRRSVSSVSNRPVTLTVPRVAPALVA